MTSLRVFPAVPKWADKKGNRLAATCRIVQLEEAVSAHRLRVEREVQEILDAISDREVTDQEARRIVSILQGWARHERQIASELTVIADGAEMVRSLASTFAVTPKISRKLREKGQDYLRLVVNNDPIEVA